VNYSFDDQVRAWSNPPVDDVGYIPSATMLTWTDDHLREVVEEMRRVRYSEVAWRNWEGGWVKGLRLDQLEGKRVLEFGCGVGLEAMEMSSRGAHVALSDIGADNLALAERVMWLYGEEPVGAWAINRDAPYVQRVGTGLGQVGVDVVHCSGVLHHIPYAKDVVDWFATILKPGGEVHLMLYSDRGWRHFVGTEPPVDTVNDPNFNNFVRIFDQVGTYADWYDEAKVAALCGEGFTLEEYRYITVDDRYCTAVLKRK